MELAVYGYYLHVLRRKIVIHRNRVPRHRPHHPLPSQLIAPSISFSIK